MNYIQDYTSGQSHKYTTITFFGCLPAADGDGVLEHRLATPSLSPSTNSHRSLSRRRSDSAANTRAPAAAAMPSPGSSRRRHNLVVPFLHTGRLAATARSTRAAARRFLKPPPAAEPDTRCTLQCRTASRRPRVAPCRVVAVRVRPCGESRREILPWPWLLGCGVSCMCAGVI
jgi:hypothetical protein